MKYIFKSSISWIIYNILLHFLSTAKVQLSSKEDNCNSDSYKNNEEGGDHVVKAHWIQTILRKTISRILFCPFDCDPVDVSIFDVFFLWNS